jgi:hypothetical protein
LLKEYRQLINEKITAPERIFEYEGDKIKFMKWNEKSCKKYWKKQRIKKIGIDIFVHFHLNKLDFIKDPIFISFRAGSSDFIFLN